MNATAIALRTVFRLAVFCATITPAYAQVATEVGKCTDAAGNVTLTDQPCAALTDGDGVQTPVPVRTAPQITRIRLSADEIPTAARARELARASAARAVPLKPRPIDAITLKAAHTMLLSQDGMRSQKLAGLQ